MATWIWWCWICSWFYRTKN